MCYTLEVVQGCEIADVPITSIILKGKRLYTCMWLCVSEHDVADASQSSTSILLLEAYILHGWILYEAAKRNDHKR